MNHDRVIVFDLGGVLVKVIRQLTIDRLAELAGTTAENVRAVLATPRTVGESDSLGELYGRGQITSDTYCEEVAQRLGGRLSAQGVREAELLTLGDEMVETTEILTELIKRALVVCLSNTHEIHWQELLQNYSAMRLFAHRFASQDLGIQKPDPKIYQAVERALAIEPGRCLLIDDTLVNVESARVYGWDAIHFKSASDLREGLVQRGALGS